MHFRAARKGEPDSLAEGIKNLATLVPRHARQQQVLRSQGPRYIAIRPADDFDKGVKKVVHGPVGVGLYMDPAVPEAHVLRT